MRRVIGYQLLGPLKVIADGQVVPLTAAKPRTVLAVLLLNANRTVSIDDLAEHLWPTSAPADVRGTVQKYVMRLRRILDLDGYDDHGIHTESEGYRLRLPVTDLDLNLFDDLVLQGSRSARDGDLTRESAQLREALALWHGLPPLSNVPSDLVQRRYVPQLVERYLQSLERRIDVDLALGRHPQLVAELTGLVEDHPLQERFWAQLMRALAGAGRRGEAMETYRRIVRLLDVELGIQPGAELRDIHQRVLRGEEHATVAGPVRRPLRRQREQAEYRPPRQLPMVTAGFIGRRLEVDRITTTLTAAIKGQAPQIIALTGTPGVGKTALAVKVAHEVADQFCDGQLFADLQGHLGDNPQTLLQILGRFINALEPSSPALLLGLDDQVLAYRSLLADRRLLVFLDNVRDPEQVRSLLPGSPGGAAIVTSRSELAGLAVSPGANLIRVGMLSDREGLQLLQEELGAGRCASDETAVLELLRLCNGLTLALRLAAKYLALRPGLRIRDYVAGLRDGDRISGLAVGDSDESTLAAAFDRSYQFMDSDQRRLLRLLSLSPGPDFNVRAAAALGGISDGEAGQELERLASISLLDRGHRGRYQLHDLTREYAARRSLLEDAVTVRQLARGRLFDHYVRATDAVVPAFVSVNCLPRPPVELVADRDQGLAELDDDRAAMVAAIRSAAHQGPYDAAYHLADALRGYFRMRGNTADWSAVVEAGLSAARKVEADEAIAAMLNSRGSLNRLMRDHRQATEDLEEALGIYERLGSPSADSVRTNLGNLAVNTYDFEAAVRYHETAMAAAHRRGDARLEHRARQNLAVALLTRGDLAGGGKHVAPLLRSATGQERHFALCLAGMLTQRMGNLSDAAVLLEDAVAACVDNADQVTRQEVLVQLAACYLELGRDDDAMATARTVLTSRVDAPAAVIAHVAMARVMSRAGQPAKARLSCGEALREAREGQFRDEECLALICAAELDLSDGLAGAATALASAAADLARGLDIRLRHIEALVVLARCQRLAGDLDQAKKSADEALTLAVVCAYPAGQAMALATLGDIQTSAGRPDDAIESWQNAHRIYRAIGSSRGSEIERPGSARSDSAGPVTELHRHGCSAEWSDPPSVRSHDAL